MKRRTLLGMLAALPATALAKWLPRGGDEQVKSLTPRPIYPYTGIGGGFGLQLECPYDLIEVRSVLRFPGYIRRVELVTPPFESTDPFEMICCYAEDTGHWIGEEQDAIFLCNDKGLRLLQRISPRPGAPCQLGFSEKEQKWYGWSHRAIYGFGVGDVITEATRANPLVGKEIRTLAEAKSAAADFAELVS